MGAGSPPHRDRGDPGRGWPRRGSGIQLSPEETKKLLSDTTFRVTTANGSKVATYNAADGTRVLDGRTVRALEPIAERNELTATDGARRSGTCAVAPKRASSSSSAATRI